MASSARGVIFEQAPPRAETLTLRYFFWILASVAVVVIDSVPQLHAQYEATLWRCEIFFTAIFTAEYLTRVWCTQQRRAYLLSFWASLIFCDIAYLYRHSCARSRTPCSRPSFAGCARIQNPAANVAVHRAQRNISRRSTARSIFVFLIMVMLVVIVFACIMYVIEGCEQWIREHPDEYLLGSRDHHNRGLRRSRATDTGWAFCRRFRMLVGYSIIAVPTAIITRELWERINQRAASVNTAPELSGLCAARTLAWTPRTANTAVPS